MSAIRLLAQRLTLGNPGSAGRLAVRLATATVALGVAVMLVSFSLLRGYQTALRDQLTGFVGDLALTREADGLQLERTPIPRTKSLEAAAKRAIPELQSMAPFAAVEVLLKAPPDANNRRLHEGVLLKGYELAPEPDFLRSQVTAGRLPAVASGAAFSREVLVSEALAKRLQLKLGDKVRVVLLLEGRARGRVGVVVGTFATGLEELDRNVVYTDLRLLQQLLRKPNPALRAAQDSLRVLQNLPLQRRNPRLYLPTYNRLRKQVATLPETVPWNTKDIHGYEVRLESIGPDALAAKRAALQALAPASWQTETVEARYPQLFNWLGLLEQNVAFILVIMLVVVVVNLTTAALIVVTERTRTLGLLRALGLTRGQVHRVMWGQAVRILLHGLVWGNGVGLGLLGLQAATGWLTLDPQDYYVKAVPVAWPWLAFVVINLGTVVVCGLALGLPTVVATRVRIVRALRFR